MLLRPPICHGPVIPGLAVKSFLISGLMVDKAAGTNLPDAASGFRAYSKKSLLRLNIVTKFSYCMETIIQAGNKNLAIVSIPVTTNPKTRDSRLFKNMWQHVFKSSLAIVRSYIMFKPYIFFGYLGAFLTILGLVPFLRYMLLLIEGNQGGHIQSLMLGTTLLTAAFLSFALGVISDMIRINRSMQEDALERIKTMQFGK